MRFIDRSFLDRSRRCGALLLALGLVLISCSTVGEEDGRDEILDPEGEPTDADVALILADLPPETREVVEQYQIDIGSLLPLSPEAKASLLVTVDDVHPLEEYPSERDQELASADWTVSCLVAAGLPAERAEGTTQINIQAEGISETLEATEDDDKCFAEASLRYPFRPAPTTREEWQPYYDRQVENAACLRDHSIDVPPEPSFDEFVESGGMWTAYGEMGDSLTSEEWDELNRICPQ